MGPSLFDVNASDLCAEVTGYELVKYADETYIFVPSYNSHYINEEMAHVDEWAMSNNLRQHKKLRSL